MLIQLIFIYSVQSWPALSLNSALSPTARNQGKTKISLLKRRILLKRSESITVPTHTVQYIIYLTPICWWPLISFVSLPGGIIFTTATVHTWKLSPPLPLGWSDLIFVVEIFQNGHVASDWSLQMSFFYFKEQLTKRKCGGKKSFLNFILGPQNEPNYSDLD